MRFEKYSQPLLPFGPWLRRVVRYMSLAGLIVAVSLTIGIVGYHTLGGLGWVDAILEASMILGGMGPVAPLNGDAVKLFAAGYALFSGLVLIGVTGILMAPWVHRMLHYVNYEDTKKR